MINIYDTHYMNSYVLVIISKKIFYRNPVYSCSLVFALHTHTYMQARTVYVGHASENTLHIRVHMEQRYIYKQRPSIAKPAPAMIIVVVEAIAKKAMQERQQREKANLNTSSF